MLQDLHIEIFMIMWWLKTCMMTKRTSTSAPCILSSGVPQGSELGALRFFLFTCILSEVISSHAFIAPLCWWHQIISSFPRSDSHISARISVCLADVLSWMAAHHLKLSLRQTEVLEIPRELSSHHMTMHETLVKLSFSSHISRLTQVIQVLLCNIRWIWEFLWRPEGLFSPLGSQIGLLKYAQTSVTDPGAWLVFNMSIISCIHSLLRSLHWLAVAACCLKFTTLKGEGRGGKYRLQLWPSGSRIWHPWIICTSIRIYF